MATISPSDIVFATVTLRGAIVASLRLSGLNSFDELMTRVRQSLSTLRGLVTLDLRCLNAGWSRRSALLVR